MPNSINHVKASVAGPERTTVEEVFAKGGIEQNPNI